MPNVVVRRCISLDPVDVTDVAVIECRSTEELELQFKAGKRLKKQHGGRVAYDALCAFGGKLK